MKVIYDAGTGRLDEILTSANLTWAQQHGKHCGREPLSMAPLPSIGVHHSMTKAMRRPQTSAPSQHTVDRMACAATLASLASASSKP